MAWYKGVSKRDNGDLTMNLGDFVKMKKIQKKKLSKFFGYRSMKNIIIFFTGFLQVALVCAQTHQIAHGNLGIIFTFGFLISFIWCYNVTKIAVGTLTAKLIYSVGAATGSIVGVVVSKLILKVI